MLEILKRLWYGGHKIPKNGHSRIWTETKRYSALIPIGQSKKLPVLVVLHGADNRHVNVKVKPRPENEFDRLLYSVTDPYIIVYPKYTIFAVNEDKSTQRMYKVSEIEQTLNDINNDLDIDEKRIYVTAYSMGVQPILNMMINHPKIIKRFAATVWVHPFIIDNIEEDSRLLDNEEMRNNLITLNKVIREIKEVPIPIWIFHSYEDMLNKKSDWGDSILDNIEKLYNTYDGVKATIYMKGSHEQGFRNPFEIENVEDYDKKYTKYDPDILSIEKWLSQYVAL